MCSIIRSNFLLQCLHAHIRWESTHIGWSWTCSIGFISSCKIIVRVVWCYCLMPIEETGEARVRTDCLNFDVCLRILIENILIVGRRHQEYISLGFQIPLQIRIAQNFQFINRYTPTISERCHQENMLPALWKRSWETTREYVTSVMRNVTSVMKKVLRNNKQQGRPNVKVCVAEENLGEEKWLSQYSIIVSIRISTLMFFSQHNLSGFLLYQYGIFWCAI